MKQEVFDEIMEWTKINKYNLAKKCQNDYVFILANTIQIVETG